MRDGEFYDLHPPSIRTGKTFHRVQCEYRVPSQPNEYVVRGIPEGGTEPGSFVLRFTDRGLSATVAKEKGLAVTPTKKPTLRVIPGGKSN